MKLSGKKFIAVAFIATFALASCSKDKADDTTAASEAVVETEAPAAETQAPAAETEAAPAAETVATETAAPSAETQAAAAPAEGGLSYALKEWSLEGSPTLTAGKSDLKITNAGKFPHEFRILKGTYEALPKNDLGTVQTAGLPADAQLGLVEKIEPGKDAALSVDLPAGQYLFVCNIEFGPNSHAGKGQVLNVTVA
jgi:uncharacterized cupredoxin-like copper-binding protein